MREVTDEINKDPNWDSKNFKPYSHNCQCFVDEARKRYNKKIKKLSKKRRDRIAREKKAIEKYWKTHFTKRRGHGKQKVLGGK